MVKFSPDVSIYGLLQHNYPDFALILVSTGSHRLKAPDYQQFLRFIEADRQQAGTSVHPQSRADIREYDLL